MSKIAIVGCDASGKTVFVSALTEYYKAGQRIGQACALIPTDTATRRYTENLHHTMRILHEWPAATNTIETRVMKWSMVKDGKPLLEIEMMDYAGENYRQAFRDDGTVRNQEAVEALVEYIGDADFVVITVGLDNMVRCLTPEIYRDMENGREAHDRDSEAQWITHGLLRLVQAKLNTNPPGVVVALTQADKHRGLLSEYGGAKGLFGRCWAEIDMMYPNLNVVAVASVDKLTAGGFPADDYKTGGVLAVMKEFSRYAFGDCDEIALRLGRLQERLCNFTDVLSPSAFLETMTDFESALNDLHDKTAMVQELYKQDFQAKEKFLERCRLFWEGISEIERRPLESQANTEHWEAQFGLFPEMTGTIRGFTNYYLRKAEQNREEERRKEQERQEALRRAEETRRREEEEMRRKEQERQRIELERQEALRREEELQRRRDAEHREAMRKAEEEQQRKEFARQEALRREAEERRRKEEEEKHRQELERIKAEAQRIKVESEIKDRREKTRAACLKLISFGGVLLVLAGIFCASFIVFKIKEQERLKKRQDAADKSSREERERIAWINAKSLEKAKEAEKAEAKANEERAKAEAAKHAAAAESERRKAADASARRAEAEAEKAKLSREIAKAQAEDSKAKVEANRLRIEEERRRSEEKRRKEESRRAEINAMVDDLRRELSGDNLEQARELISKLSLMPLTKQQKSVIDFAETFCDRLERANNGDSDSMAWVALQHSEQKTCVKQDRRKAAEWYRKAANAGNVNAMYRVALWAEIGKGGPVDKQNALRWYKKAAAANHGDALYRLGIFYAQGRMGLEKSNAKAHESFVRAKENGCTHKDKKTGVDAWIKATQGAEKKTEKSWWR